MHRRYSPRCLVRDRATLVFTGGVGHTSCEKAHNLTKAEQTCRLAVLPSFYSSGAAPAYYGESRRNLRLVAML